MFKEGNLVRAITEEGDGEIMRVLEDSVDGATHVAIGNDDGDTYFDTNDLELVTNDQQELKSTPQKANINSIEDGTLHDQFNKYLVSVITSLRKRGFEGRIELSVDVDHYSGESAEIFYTVELDNNYAGKVRSDNLGKSAHIALSRYEENERLQVNAIPFMVDDEAAA
jgi:hypothetical protein